MVEVTDLSLVVGSLFQKEAQRNEPFVVVNLEVVTGRDQLTTSADC